MPLAFVWYTDLTYLSPTVVTESAVVTRIQFHALNRHVSFVSENGCKLHKHVVAVSFLDLWNLL